MVVVDEKERNTHTFSVRMVLAILSEFKQFKLYLSIKFVRGSWTNGLLTIAGPK